MKWFRAFHRHKEYKTLITLNIAILNVLQLVHAKHSFKLSKLNHHSVALVERAEKIFWLPQVLLLLRVPTQTNDRFLEEFSSVTYLEFAFPLVIVSSDPNYLYKIGNRSFV